MNPSTATPETTATPLAEALRYADIGWLVFPVAKGTKRPFAGSAGVNDASAEPDQIRRWWTQHPDADIGVACGASGLVAIDVDVRTGGPASIVELSGKHGALPATVEAITPTGGVHLIYQMPDSGRIGCAVGKWPGVDVKGDGGYVVVAPSRHPSGGAYAWQAGQAPFDRKPAPLPTWLAQAMRAPAAGAEADSIAEGQRNGCLTSAAGALRARGLGPGAIEAALQAVNATECRPPLPSHEVSAIARSIGAKAAGSATDTSSRCFRLMDRAALFDLPPLQWLVEGVLPAGGFGLLYGEAGGGKTFAALGLAYAISTGLEWFGRTVVRGDVVYIAAEGSAGLTSRVAALEATHGAEAAGLSFITEGVQFARATDGDALLAALSACPPVLLVVDTLARCLVGGDENSAKDAGLFIDGIDRVRKALGCAVLVIHHSGKSGDSYRGSSAFMGAADTVIKFCADGAFLKLECVKQKDGEGFGRINALLRRIGDSCIVEPSDATSHAKSESVTKAVEALRDIAGPGDWVTMADWRKAAKMLPGTFAKAVKTAVESQLVEPRGEARKREFRLVPSAQEQP